MNKKEEILDRIEDKYEEVDDDRLNQGDIIPEIVGSFCSSNEKMLEVLEEIDEEMPLPIRNRILLFLERYFQDKAKKENLL